MGVSHTYFDNVSLNVRIVNTAYRVLVQYINDTYPPLAIGLKTKILGAGWGRN